MLENIKRNIGRIKANGATYVDTRWYPFEETNSLTMWNGNLKENDYTRESGVGIRVLYKGAWGFSASSDLNDLDALYNKAFDNAKVAAKRVTFPVRLAEKDAIIAKFTSPNQIDPFTVSLSEKVGFMKDVDEMLNKPGIAQRIASLNFVKKQIIFVDSEGAEIEKNITEVFSGMQIVGLDSDGQAHTRQFGLGREGMKTRGWESVRKELFAKNADRITQEMSEIVVAEKCPQENRSVIILPDMMYLQTHETIGHPLELDRILGYELAFAGGSFVTLEDFGSLQYGSKKLNARADGTLENSPGSYGYDDDGVECKNEMLIENGVLVGAITGRQMVEEANIKAGRQIFKESGGANRASSFYKVPIERMTNINIDPGDDGNLEDIIANTEKGMIVSGAKSWSIGSNREQFHFATEVGRMVEDGEVKDMVRNPTYKGDTLKFWNSLSAVGDESTWEVTYTDNCGKGQPNQIMQLGHGIPICKFDDVRIGE